MYDFANSAFTTLVVTFIFSQYYATVVHSDPVRGGVWWGRAVAGSAVAVALLMPVLGAAADEGGLKKRLLVLTTAACCVFTGALFFVGPGNALTGALIFVAANVAYEAAQVFYNAFLPEISTRRNVGRISGFAWGLGYVGGLACLVVALAMVRGQPAFVARLLPETDFLNVRATNLLTAAWVIVFAVPVFRHLKERVPRRPVRWASAGVVGLKRLRETARDLRRYRQAVRFLIARLVYNDGLVTVFAMASIYAAAVFGMDTAELIVLGIVVNLASGASSIVFGFVNDRIGGKKTIAISLVALSAVSTMAYLAQSLAAFWVAALLLGLMVGPNQSASRALLSSFVPEGKQGELFGLYAFSGKLASVLGPLSYSAVLGTTGSHRWAMLSVAAFFLVGLALLARVDEQEGIEAAARQAG